MLVLSRQRDETIMIGDEIEITVVDIRGDKVRLGITAPSKIAVHRKEIYEAIKQENRQASRIDRGDLTAVSPPRVRPAATPRLVVGPQPPAPPVRPQGAPAPGAAPRTVIGSLRAAQ